MSEKTGYIITLILIGASGALLAVGRANGEQPWFSSALWFIGGFWAIHLGRLLWLCCRPGQTEKSSENANADFSLPADSLLDFSELAKNLNEQTRRLMQPSFEQGLCNGAILRDNLEKALPCLAKLARRYPLDPGPSALRSHALILLSNLISREESRRQGLEYLEHRKWNSGLAMLNHAIELDPRNALFIAEAGRLLEERSALLSINAENTAYFLHQALNHYEKATDINPELAEAWRRRGRVLLRLSAFTSPGRHLESLLEQAVECYETARRQPGWGEAFYLEFGLTVFELAQTTEAKKLHYLTYAARLFTLASEKNPLDSAPALQVGKVMSLAAAAYEELKNKEKADEIYQEALEYFKKAARLDPADPVSRIQGARTLAALFKLKSNPADQATELLSEAIGLCAQAALLNDTEEVYSEWANVLGLLADNCPERASRLWADAAEKYGKAASFEQTPPDRAVINWHNWAYSLTSQAQSQASAVKRQALLREALDKYNRAAELSGDNLIILKNTGEVLAELAMLENDREASAELNCHSEDCFRKAAELYPDQAGPWRRWGHSLVIRARAERDPVRRRVLWQDVIDKLERGTKAQPDEAMIWAMWGHVLNELMWESPEYERPLLAAGAMEKYETSLNLAPDDDEIWNHLGRVCLEASGLSENLAARGALAGAMAAAEHFQHACDLNPHQAHHWAEWGRASFKIAQTMDNEASSLAALKESYEKYETAVALAPDNSDYRACLCRVLYQWGWCLDEPEQKRAHFRQAYEHCREAGRLAPHDPVVWRDWGKIIEALAGMENDPRKSADWQREADEKYYQAAALEITGNRFQRH